MSSSAPASLHLPVGRAAPRTPAQDAGWAVLDDPAEWSRFGRPLPDREGYWEAYLAIDGMHCAACTLAVEAALGPVPGVDSVQVNGASATARLVWAEAGARPSRWLEALQASGYGATPAGDLLEAAPRVRARKLLLWQWLVAGFGMMQAMMYSLPLYVAGPGEITPDIEALLRWGAWMMTLPVVLFSCRPFFSGAWRDLAQRRVGMDVPVALGMLIAFMASTAATFDPAGPWGGEVWYDSLTMFVFFLLSGRLLEQRLRDRTAGALEALIRALPASIERWTPAADDGPGAWQRVPVRQLAVGDRIRVLPGEVFPVDGRIEAGESRVDEALLTGESKPLVRCVADAVIAGSHNLTGAVTVSVERLGPETRHAGIVALMQRAAHDKPRLARLADRLAGPFLWAVLAAAGGAAMAGWSAGPAQALATAVAVLIVTCPCALSLATPAATLATAGALARRGVLVSRLQALESLAGADTVVFDKTGTLTQEGMTLTAVRCRQGATPDAVLAIAAALASHSMHPVSRALVAAASARNIDGAIVSDVMERAGAGVEGMAHGKQRVRLGSGVFCAAPPQGGDSLQAHLADETGWLASFDFSETLRPDAVAAIAALMQMGLAVRLLSGDRPEAVARLARCVGIAHWEGGCSPEDKLAKVRALQAQGRRVVMVGDGMNDGPVLACADVAVAMGQAVPLAQVRSDVVLQGNQVGAVVTLVSQARRLRRIVRQNLLWAAVYNGACVPLAVAGLMPPWLAGLGMAASSLAVVMNSARLARLDGFALDDGAPHPHLSPTPAAAS